MPARCRHFRLCKTFKGWADGRKGGDIIIALIVHGIAIGYSTDRNHIGHIAGRTDRHRIRTGITRRHDNRNPRIPSCHDGLINGVLPVVRDRITLKGQGQNLDIKTLAMLNHIGNRADNIQVGAFTFIVKGFHHNQINVRRDTVVTTGSVTRSIIACF